MTHLNKKINRTTLPYCIVKEYLILKNNKTTDKLGRKR